MLGLSLRESHFLRSSDLHPYSVLLDVVIRLCSRCSIKQSAPEHFSFSTLLRVSRTITKALLYQSIIERKITGLYFTHCNSSTVNLHFARLVTLRCWQQIREFSTVLSTLHLVFCSTSWKSYHLQLTFYVTAVPVVIQNLIAASWSRHFSHRS